MTNAEIVLVEAQQAREPKVTKVTKESMVLESSGMWMQVLQWQAKLLANNGMQTQVLRRASWRQAKERMEPTKIGSKEPIPEDGTLTQELKDGK